MIKKYLVLVAIIANVHHVSHADEITGDKSTLPNLGSQSIVKNENKTTDDKDTKNDEYYDIEEDPSFPSLYVGYGANILGSNPNSEIKTSLWGSRFLDFSLCYNLVAPETRFAVSVGMGYSNGTLSFKPFNGDYYTLGRNKDTRYTEKTVAKSSLSTKGEAYSTGSYINMHFINFLIDLVLFADKIYHKDGFIFSLGGKIYVLTGSNVEVAYVEDSVTKTQSISEKLNLRTFNWGLKARVAWGRFGFVYEILFSDLFSKMDNGTLKGPKIEYMQKVGLSIDLF